MAQPKGQKSNNQKKETWYCFTSKENLLRMLRGQGILSWYDVYLPDKRITKACEADILEFINRECRALRKSIK